jgi:DNA-binding MarR family transcriptional regulator
MASISAPTDLSARLRLVVARTTRRLRQEAGAGLTADLSPALTAALATIDRHGPLTPSELAARERVQRPTATRLLARLEVEGLVLRSPDPADGRSSVVAVSPEGRALLRKLRTRKNAYLARLLRDADPAELETIERAVGILERLLEEDTRS